MTDTYLTISHKSEGEYSEKRSKFLAFAYHVETTEEIKNIVNSCEKEYHDARHVCYAYMLGPQHETFRAVDNGEPSGTAGKPILGQIVKNNLTNILIVVVRYFGGIKLGTTNLKNAFLSVASDLIKTENLCEIKQTLLYQIKIDYSQIKIINRQFNNQIIDRKYNDLDVTFFFCFEKEQINLFTDYDATLVNNKYIVKCYNI